VDRTPSPAQSSTWTGQTALERLRKLLPGFRGYARREHRREADGLLRGFGAVRIARAAARIESAVQTQRNGESLAVGATRVVASYHWEGVDGGRVVWDGARTRLPGDIEPSAAAALALAVRAPEAPGRYVLVLDLVRENIAWFSSRDPAAALRLTVEVEAP